MSSMIPLPQGYEPHELPADYTGKLWIEGQMREYATLVAAAEREAMYVAPAVQPVAWMVYTLDGKSVFVTDNPSDFTGQHRALPLYTTPYKEKRGTVQECANAIRERGQA